MIHGVVGLKSSSKAGFKRKKDAKIAKMRVFVHFASFENPCFEKHPKKGPSRGT